MKRRDAMAGLKLSKSDATRIALVPSTSLPAVEETLTKLGVDWAWVDAPPPPPDDGSDADFIVGLGPVGLTSALAYATAMGRPCRGFDSFDAMLDWLATRGSSTAFVFLSAATMTLAAMSPMVERATAAESSVGFLPLPEDVGLALATTLRLVALSLSDPPNEWAPVLSSVDTPREETEALFGDADDVEVFRERARAGYAAIVVHGHGNGADIKLGGGAVLCVQADALKPELARAGDAALPCQFGGVCLRREKHFLGATDLKTSVLVLLSCTGWLPAGSLIDPKFGIATAVMRGPWVRVIATAMEGAQIPWTFATAAVDFVAQGGAAGDLVLQLNQQSPEGARPFLCIGDPTTIAPPPARTNPRPEALPSGAPADPGDAPREITLPTTSVRGLVVRELVAAGIYTPEEVEPLMRIARGESVDETTAHAFAPFLAMDATRRQGGLPFVYDSPSRPAEALENDLRVVSPYRHTCGATLLSLPYVWKVGLPAGRTEWVCRRCGAIADAPTGTPPPWLGFVEPARRVRVHALPPQRPLSVACAIEASGKTRGVVGEARVLGDGESSLELEVPRGAVAQGLQVFVVALSWREDFALLRLPHVRWENEEPC